MTDASAQQPDGAGSSDWSARLRAFVGEILSVKGIGVGLLCASILSGKIDLGRISQGGVGEWLELRWVFLVVALGIIVAARREFPIRWQVGKTVFLSLFAVYLVYLAIRNTPFSTPDAYLKYLDVATVFVQCLVTALIVGDRETRKLFYIWVVVCGLILFLLALAGASDQNLSGHGWAPLSGPITFSRIEFLAFCVAVALAHGGVGALVMIVAIASLFALGTLASLQKIVFLAFFASAAVLVTLSLFQGQWRRSFISAMAVVVGVGIWSQVFGDIFAARVDQSYSAEEVLEGVPIGGAIAKVGLGDMAVDLNFCIFETTRANAPEKIGEHVCKQFQYVDRTARLTFIVTAMSQFIGSPVIGQGLATYHIFLVNRYTGVIEEYKYPHNIVLEVLQESGLIGFALIAAMMASLFYFSATSSIDRLERVPLLCFMMFIFVTMVFSGDFYDSRLFWLIGLISLESARARHA